MPPFLPIAGGAQAILPGILLAISPSVRPHGRGLLRADPADVGL
ncbi:MAG TPA: hypothetical protein VH458_17580 [Vicinamibacterales bacterium]|jgi:hypothetical protein